MELEDNINLTQITEDNHTSLEDNSVRAHGQNNKLRRVESEKQKVDHFSSWKTPKTEDDHASSEDNLMRAHGQNNKLRRVES